MTRPSRVGLPWYSTDHYDMLRRSLSDGDKLPAQYETWRISTEQVEREVRRSGVEVVRVLIEPEAFVAWCERTGSMNAGAGRSRYASKAVAGPINNTE